MSAAPANICGIADGNKVLSEFISIVILTILAFLYRPSVLDMVSFVYARFIGEVSVKGLFYHRLLPVVSAS